MNFEWITSISDEDWNLHEARGEGFREFPLDEFRQRSDLAPDEKWHDEFDAWSRRHEERYTRWPCPPSPGGPRVKIHVNGLPNSLWADRG